ncbi:uncharacterized protein YbjQ (UPF0145 family) [Deinococcus metalli]|uniref:Uncharacterized protein YbjQ (UPF0145 family) n=1 Tax=Deinococcus metalli TaxID=1141878 RepID=A0A7W8KJ94_9DEIO|nr:hypothetical protein [Deinococcus metalli]MBB5379157.1 uncharacterized protein YbjQ (UPF0145 family) [Deinococcus metalli]GHF64560.1 hypothetical protein GCM10017781_45520 [Deinococcus metalli]
MPEPYALVARLRDQGLTPVEVARAGHAEGFDLLQVMGLVRAVCGASIVEAKDAAMQAVYGQTLDEYQEELAAWMMADAPHD